MCFYFNDANMRGKEGRGVGECREGYGGINREGKILKYISF